jgi:mono/diheme cytochrome c family protein
MTVFTRAGWTGFAALGVTLAFAMPAVKAADPARPVTFSKDIAPIFQAKCQECHQPESIAPMSLITFADVRPWVGSIKTRVATRQMPPWHLDKGVGVQKFKNDMSLTDQQIDTIVSWVDSGALQGDPKDLPKPKPLVTTNEWKGSATASTPISSSARRRRCPQCIRTGGGPRATSR